MKGIHRRGAIAVARSSTGVRSLRAPARASLAVLAGRVEPTLPEARNCACDVPPAELRHRAHEGLQALGALMDGLGTIGEAALFDHVMEEMEPAEARLVAFTAAVVAHGQAARLVVG